MYEELEGRSLQVNRMTKTHIVYWGKHSSGTPIGYGIPLKDIRLDWNPSDGDWFVIERGRIRKESNEEMRKRVRKR
tara:strand:- start:772 stop:999 length:228 start_codon:yes stop_codon:yes gene_type:complete